MNPRVLYLKGWLFVLCGTMGAALVVLERPSIRIAVLLAITVWCFARAYYFAFYVIERYVDPTYRFAGLWSLVCYATKAKKGPRW